MIVKFRMDSGCPTTTLFGHTWAWEWAPVKECGCCGLHWSAFDDDKWEAQEKGLSKDEEELLCDLTQDIPWQDHLERIERVCRAMGVEMTIGKQVRAWIEDGELFFTLDTEADTWEDGEHIWGWRFDRQLGRMWDSHWNTCIS